MNWTTGFHPSIHPHTFPLLPLLTALPSQLCASFHSSILLSSSQDVAMAGLWSAGSSLDVESAAILCGHCFCYPAAGNHLQQEVWFCFFNLNSIVFYIFASVLVSFLSIMRKLCWQFMDNCELPVFLQSGFWSHGNSVTSMR